MTTKKSLSVDQQRWEENSPGTVKRKRMPDAVLDDSGRLSDALVIDMIAGGVADKLLGTSIRDKPKNWNNKTLKGTFEYSDDKGTLLLTTPYTQSRRISKDKYAVVFENDKGHEVCWKAMSLSSSEHDLLVLSSEKAKNSVPAGLRKNEIVVIYLDVIDVLKRTGCDMSSPSAIRKGRERLYADAARLRDSVIDFVGSPIEWYGKPYTPKLSCHIFDSIDDGKRHPDIMEITVNRKYYDKVIRGRDTAFVKSDGRWLLYEGGNEETVKTLIRILRNRYNTPNNRKRGIHNVIKICTLLNRLHKIPTHAEVRKGNRDYLGRIFEPLNNALRLAKTDRFITSYDYCDKNKNVVPWKKLAESKSAPWLLDLYLTYTMPETEDWPEDDKEETEEPTGKVKPKSVTTT